MAKSVGAGLVCLILALLFLPALLQDREAERRLPCLSMNLKHIAVAMLNYENTYKSFPPAYIADKHGRPMHSWRTLILPFFDDPSLKSLYDRYRFDEPWDSAHNKDVTNIELDIYQCPSQPNSKDPTTNYMVVVGDHAYSDGPHGRKTADIKDGMTHTIMLVEVADSSTWWAEPVDLDFNKMSFKINGSKRQGISSYHSGGANVAYFDGGVRCLSNTTNPELVKAMITIDGAEKTPDDSPSPPSR